jgi:RHS repeat-associated protein
LVGYLNIKKMKAFKKRIILSFIYIMIVQFSIAQSYSISGESCALPNVRYTYTFSGSYPSNVYQYCYVTGGTFVGNTANSVTIMWIGYGDMGPANFTCYYGIPVTFNVQVAASWSNTVNLTGYTFSNNTISSVTANYSAEAGTTCPFTYTWTDAGDAGNFNTIVGTNKDLNLSNLNKSTVTLRREVRVSGNSSNVWYSNVLGIQAKISAAGQDAGTLTPSPGVMCSSASCIWWESTDMINWTYLNHNGYSSYNPGVLNATRYYKADVTCSGQSGNNTAIFKIEVVPPLNGGIIVAPGPVKAGQLSGTIISQQPGGGNGCSVPTYQWEKSDDGVNFTPVPNATGENYSPGLHNMSTWYRRKVSCIGISGYSNVVLCQVIALPPGGMPSLGKGVEDLPNTSVIPLVKGGAPVKNQYNPAGNQSLFHTIKNVLALQVLEESNANKFIPGDFTASVQLRVEYGHSDNPAGLCSKDINLTVNYTKDAGGKYDALNYFMFEDAEFVSVTVTDVQAPTTVNGVAFDTKEVLKLTNTLLSTRYYQLADNKMPDLTVPASLPATGVDALHVSWTVPANTNNNAVQLEWAWLEQGMDDDYKNSNNQVDPNLVLKAGATRIDLAEGAAGGSYDIPMLYDGSGTLYVRARAVNVMPSGSRSDGPWSDIKSCSYAGHEKDLNWQVTTSYAEEGKRKTVIQYFDGTLRPRQTVTKDNTTGQTVVAETMYDMEGRPAVQILPAPGIDNIIAYRENLNKFNGQTDNTNPADYFDFTTSTSGYYATRPLDENLGTAKYYSVQNPDRNTGIHQNIPVANGYPYSVTRYTPDGTGRILRQSGPGDAHKMGNGHDTKYFYGTPKQEELDALFGTEVGYVDHYFKNMVQDANGQMNVTYLDMQGRTIATALAGEATPLAPLPGSGLSPYQDNTFNLLLTGSNLLKGNSIESVSSLLVPYKTVHTFKYKLNKQTITLPACDGGTVTYDCKFDLQLAITDETGEYNPVVFNYTDRSEIDITEPVELEVGSYSVRKTLTINQAWLQNLITQYSADGVGVCSTLVQLTNTITAEDIQNSGCNLPTTPLTSSDCLAALGTFENYRDNYAASINVAVGNLTAEQLKDLKVQYDEAVALCTSLDPTKSSSLAAIRQQMLADMVPYTGQYADANKIGSKYNIFATSGGLTSPQPYYKNPRNESPATSDYYNDYGSIDQSVSAAALQGMSNDKFAEVFNQSWAKALIKYHPEYNKLVWAENNLRSSYDFIDNLQANTTAYDPIPADPFFNITGQTDKDDLVRNYVYGGTGGYGMWQLAYGDALGCKIILDNAQRNICYSNVPNAFTATGSVVSTGFANVTLTAALQSQAWSVYKGLYCQVRNEYVNAYINESGRDSENGTLIGQGYRLHFPKNFSEAAQSNANASNTGEWTSIIPDAQGNFPNIDYNQTSAQYSHPCESYINTWRLALLDCPQLAARGDKEEILTTIISRMQTVCRNGTDAANPYGASTVAPAYSSGAYTSFEQVILNVFGEKGITVTEFCHPYGIEFPKPYGMNPPITKQYASTVETCTCTQWNKLLQEMSQAGNPPSNLAGVNAYLSATYHETITPELYAGLLKCGQSFQICRATTDPDPCPECRVTATAAAPSGQTCTYSSSLPLISPQPLPYFLVCGFDKNIARCYNCTAFVNLQTSFNGIFGQEPVLTGTVPDNKVVWNDLFAKYVNYKTGLQHTWMYYAGKFNVNACPVGGVSGIAYNSDLSICREDKPINDATVDNPPSPCDAITAGSKLKAIIQYDYMKRKAMDDFRAAYIDKCVAATETFTVNYAPKEYHYTLYYYDRAGNLVKTVPPKGVIPNYTKSFQNTVVAERDKMKNGLPYTETTPDHALDTRYIYNSLNKLVKKKTPDAGISQYWYDELGSQVAAQNAKQTLAGNVYSYTKYDELTRVVQTSEITSTTPLTDAISKSNTALTGWYSNAYNFQTQVVQTIYDEGYSIIDGYVFNQDNLRNRVAYTRVWNSIGDPYAASATYYNYDIHGNVNELLRDFGNSNGVANIMNQSGNRFKRVVYDYDLISGKVNKVSYQPGQSDAYYHRYEYDAELRITDVYSGRDEIMLNTLLFPEREAHYDNYKHGPVARTTLGQLLVQKQDFAYTINSWLKAVNPAFGGTLANGTNTAEANPVAQDVFGFSLHYFDNDYRAIGYTPQPNSILGSLGSNAQSMYNGNIAAIALNIPKLGAPKVYNYHYDQLNRIVAMDAYNGLNVSTGTFTPGTPLDDYKERIGYDPNGNILSYQRNGDAARPVMDILTYNYTPGTNRLHKVTDLATDAPTADYSKYNDIKQGQADDNYEYDLIGNLVKDHSENVDISWNVYGKIASINKAGSVSNYMYDAADNRILKVTATGSTAYVRDGDGNVLSVYTKQANGSLIQSEVNLYGSKRLGIVTTPRVADALVVMGCGFSNGIIRTFTRGEKLFELSNHLGNVLVTVTDRRIAFPQANTTFIDHYEADIASAQDYYPFGMLQPGRKWNAGKYRYGFNGKENDNDVKGEGNQQDYGMRIYDPRLGKFLSVDPITDQYPELTPYQFASNRPIDGIDQDGLEFCGTPEEEKEYANQKAVQKLIHSLPPPTKEMLQVMQPGNQHILTRDFYGQTIIGKRSDVENFITNQRLRHNEAVGENVRGGFFGAMGYWGWGDRGSFVGAFFDQAATVVKGFPGQSGRLSRNSVNNYRQSKSVPYTERVSTLTIKPTSLIRTERPNGNESARNVGVLMGLIRQNIKLDPVEVAVINNKMYIINGHHRTEAAMRTNTDVRFRILTKVEWQRYGYTNEQDIINAAAEANIQRVKLDNRVIQKSAKTIILK